MRILKVFSAFLAISLSVACSKDKDPSPYHGYWMSEEAYENAKRSGIYSKEDLFFVDASGKLYTLMQAQLPSNITPSNSWNYLFITVSNDALIGDEAGVRAQVQKQLKSEGLSDSEIQLANTIVDLSIANIKNEISKVRLHMVDRNRVRVADDIVEKYFIRIDDITADLVRNAQGSYYQVQLKSSNPRPKASQQTEEAIASSTQSQSKAVSKRDEKKRPALLTTGYTLMRDGSANITCYVSFDCDKLRARIQDALLRNNIRSDAFRIIIYKRSSPLTDTNELVINGDVSDDELDRILNDAVTDKEALRRLIPIVQQIRVLNESGLEIRRIGSIRISETEPILRKFLAELEERPDHALNQQKIDHIGFFNWGRAAGILDGFGFGIDINIKRFDPNRSLLDDIVKNSK